MSARRTIPESGLVGGLGELTDVVHAIDERCLVAVIDRDQRLVYANGQLLQLSEYASQEELAEAGPLWWSDRHAPEFYEALLSTVRSGKVWSGELEKQSKGGRPYRLAATIVPQLGDDGEPVRYLIVCREATTGADAAAVRALAEITATARARAATLRQKNRRLEARTKAIAAHHAELVHTEKLSALGLMASAVAHEINNPLGGVMACITALEEGTVPPERAPEYFATVRDALRRIEETVQSLLLYAHPGSVGVSEVDLREVAEGCRRLLLPLASRRDVRLEVAGLAAPVKLPGNRSALSQALMNVLLNAVQASPPGASVVVDVCESAERVGLRVTDRGAGIPATSLDRVTEPFFTTKPEGQGTGLGLHLTTRVVEDHGGRLAIESEPGLTRVTLWLPRAVAVDHEGPA